VSRRCEIRVADAAAMEALGGALATQGCRGQCITLHGPLAAGKTTFARGYLRALGHDGAVKSPTFTLVESYTLARAQVHHFDLYRLADAAELEFIGIDEYFADQADRLVEWPERGAGVLPAASVAIRIALAGSARLVALEGLDEAGCETVSRIEKIYKT